MSYNHQKYCFEESEYSIFTVASHWTKEGCLQLDFSSSAVRFRPHNVFIPVRKSLDESRDIVKEQVKTFSSAHARNQSSPATMLTMSKFLEDNILERTAADLFTYLRSDACPFTSVVKQALYDAIFQYSIMSVESRPTADGGLQTRKSYFSEKFDIIFKLPTKERELALKESESLLQVLYEALMEDLKGKHSAHALMMSLHKRISELSSQLHSERLQHKQEIQLFSEKMEKHKTENKAEMERHKAENKAAMDELGKS